MGAIWAGKIGYQTAFLVITLRQAGHRERLGALLLYKWHLLVYTARPGAIQWQERRYLWAEV